MPEKILFINQHAGYIGGLEKYISVVSELLREQGFETSLLYVERVKEFDRFAESFDEVYNMEESGKFGAEEFALSTLHKISSPEMLERMAAKFAPTAFIHDHDYFCPKGFKYFPYKRANCPRAYSGIFCGACASLVPPRHMTDGFAAMLEKNFHRSMALNAAIKKCPRFVVLSEFMKKGLLKNGIPEEKTRVIHPYVELPPATEKPENKIPEIVFAGQQVISKGVHLLIDAAAKMKSDAKIRILGSGPRLEYFKQMSADRGLSEKISFEGWVDDADRFFARADVAVFPSLWQEPFGLSGVEAMSRGTPVVAFDVGGVSEWLKDGENGLLVPERDTAAMAHALDRLIGNPEERKAMGNRARSCVAQNYSKGNFSENFKSLL